MPRIFFPVKKMALKTRRKRRLGRRRVRRTRVSRFARRPTGDSFLPPVLRTKLRYQGFNSLSSTPTMATQVIRANSLYDPNLTGAGHQPRGFDELAALYNEYRVFGVYVDVSFKVTTNTFAYVGWSQVASNVSAPTSINGVVECRRGFNKLIASDKVYRIRRYFSVAEVNSVSKEVVRADDNYKAAVSANPTEGPVIQIHAASPDESTSTVVHCNYVLTYYCQFMNPKFLSQS